MLAIEGVGDSGRTRAAVAALLGLTIALCATTASRAQAAGAIVPPPTDLTRPQAPLGQPAAPLEVHPPRVGEAPAGAAAIQVEVASIDVDGVTAYPPGALAPLYQGLAGRKVALSEIFAAAAAIEARYRADGYVLTRAVVPQQSAEGGHFHIRVVEGFVSRVEITGDPGVARRLIQRTLDRIKRRHPARLADLERGLLLVNDLPGVQARAVLSADPDQLGGARLVVEIVRKPIDAFGTLDNRGSVFAGPVTGAAGLGLNNLGPGDGRIAGTVFTTFNDEQTFGEIEGQTHVGDNGAALRAWASYSPSAPGSIFKPLGIRSHSTVVGAGASYPVIRSRRLDLAVQGTFEASEDTTRILGTLVSRDETRIVRLGVSGDLRDSLGGFTAWTATLHQGLNIAGASHDGGAVPQSRLGGRSDFTKLTGTITRVQPLWTSGPDTVALQVSAAGQYAFDKLLSLEQFHLGGESFGRGYNPAQVSGDQGLGADLELQFTGLNAIGPVTHHQLYAFFDAAEARNRGAPWQSLESYGAGVRADIGPRLSAQVEVAVPYSAGRLNGAVHDTGAQVFFRLTARY